LGLKINHVVLATAMSELMDLKAKLIQDPLFSWQFNHATDLQEAIQAASLYGINGSASDTNDDRKELRSMTKDQTFQLDLIRTVSPSLSGWVWGSGAAWGDTATGGCFDLSGACHDS
jgi:hypothetical protein